MLARTAAQRFRAAVASSKTKVSTLERQAAKLDSDDIRNPDPRGVTSLALAAAAGNVEVCEWLIFDEQHEEGQISRDTAGETVVHIVAAHGYTRILELYLSQYPFVVSWVDARGATPLHIAAMRGEMEAAQIIVNCAGLDIVDAPDLYGNTALHYACSWGKIQVVKLLVEMDCDVTAKNNEGFTAADYAFSFATLRALDEYIRLHVEHMKRQRTRRQGSPKQNRSHPVPPPVQTGQALDNASVTGSLPSMPPVGLGFGFDRNAEQARADGADTSPTRSLRPPLSPKRQRSTSSDLSGQISPSPSSTHIPSAAAPAPPTSVGSGSRPTTPGTPIRANSRPNTPQRSPLSLKRLSRNPSGTSTLASVDGDGTIKAPMRSRSHSALGAEAGNDLAPAQPLPNRSVSMKLRRKSNAGRGPPPPPPADSLAARGQSRSESAHSGVSSGSSQTPHTGSTSRAESTLSSPARSRASSAAHPTPPLLVHHSSSSMSQASPPPSPHFGPSNSSISNILSLGKNARERKGSMSSAVDADGRGRSGSNASQISGGRVARALGLARRQPSGGA